MKAVLGLHIAEGESGAALIAGGLRVAIEERKLARGGAAAVFPERSIRYVLDAAGITADDVEIAVYALSGLPNDEVAGVLAAAGYRGSVAAVRRHDAQAAAAYFSSPFDDAAIVITDARGSRADELPPGAPGNANSVLEGVFIEVQSTYRGTGGSIVPIRRTFTTPEFSLGIETFARLAAEILGLAGEGEGALSDLAAFGGKSKSFRNEIFADMNGDVLAAGIRGFEPPDPERRADYARHFFKSAPREPGGGLTNRHAEIAAYAQREINRAMLAMAAHIRAVTGSGNMCIGGAVALNPSVTGHLMESGLFDQVFAHPAAGHDCIPEGCALYGRHLILGEPRSKAAVETFFGRQYGEEDITAALKDRSGVEWTAPEDLAEQCAAAIAEGALVGFFQGGAEPGDGPLGSRCILADPREIKGRKRLDVILNRREQFIGYTAAALEEKTGDWFDRPVSGGQGIFALKVKPDVARYVPALIRVDGTACVMGVGKNRAELLHGIIESFERRAGTPLVLMVPMRGKNGGCCESPADALEFFASSDLDMLVIENFLVRKK